MHTLPSSLAALWLLLAPAPDGWLGVYLAADRKEAVVAEVLPGSPASKAGLQAGDVLVAVGDQKTPTAAEFITAIRALPAGERVKLEILRGTQQMTVLVKLGERPATAPEPQLPAPAGKGQPPRPEGEVPGGKAGAGAAAEPGYLGVRIRQDGGSVVLGAVLDDSPAKAAGLREGEVLQAIGERQIASMADVEAVLGNRPAGSKVVLGLRGPEGVRSVAVVLGVRPGSAAAARQPARATPAPKTSAPEASPAELEQEVEALRAELERLRRQIEELRKGGGRE
jgi:S1-C subfamily serine protease